MPLPPSLLLIALPAQVAGVQVPPMAPRGLDQVQGQMQAIPEAFVQGKTKGLRDLVAQARAGWDRARPELLRTVPEPEAIFIDKQLKGMLRMKPREQAVGALGIASTLARFQPKTPERDRQEARRAALLAWCGADGGQWEPQPHLGEAFKPFLDGARGRRPMEVIQVEEALKRLQVSWQKRQAGAVKKGLKDLLEASDRAGKS